MASYSLVRKHEDPAVQAEFQQVYKILTSLASAETRTILTGESTFNGTSGRLIEFPAGTPEQDPPEYTVIITPEKDTISFDEEKEIIRGTTGFTVKSTFTSGAFLWAVII
jgi:hypothetical protein